MIRRILRGVDTLVKERQAIGGSTELAQAHVRMQLLGGIGKFGIRAERQATGAGTATISDQVMRLVSWVLMMIDGLMRWVDPGHILQLSGKGIRKELCGSRDIS